ncbi:MAG: hypothetical protein ABI131_12655 [Nostocoides sp.]
MRSTQSVSSTSTPSPLVNPRVRDERARIGAVALVGGAAALALGRALDLGGGTAAERLQQASGHHGQITASALLAMIGFAALVPAFWTVADRVQHRGARLATIGALLTALGCSGFVALVAIDDFPPMAAAQSGSTEVMTGFLQHLDHVPALLALGPLAAIGYFFGPFLVTLGARRGGLVPRWLPWGFLVSLVLQPVALVLTGGPGIALHLVDTACQLVLVVMAVLLARAVLLGDSASHREGVPE